MALAAVAASVGINVGAPLHNGDGAKAAAARAGTGHASLAGIADKIAGLHAAVAGNVADGEHGPPGRLFLQRPLSKLPQGNAVVLLVFQTKAQGGDDTLAQNGTVLVNAAAGLLPPVAGPHVMGNPVHRFRKATVPEGLCNVADNAQTQGTDHIFV